MPQLNKTRRIWVYVPNDYSQSNAKYPVLYMHDGQNLFATTTSFVGEWGIDEAMQQMEKEDSHLKSIVIGIDNGGEARSDEYIPWSGHADAYVDFITQTLKPFIDDHYRTLTDREHTAIAGSSLGAYVSLYAGLKHQDIFGKIGAFSNVSTFDNGQLENFILQQGKKQEMQIYMDIGEKEEQFPGIVDADKKIHEALLKAGFTDKQVRFIVDPNGIHNETSWQRRFPDAWKWLLLTGMNN